MSFSFSNWNLVETSIWNCTWYSWAVLIRDLSFAGAPVDLMRWLLRGVVLNGALKALLFYWLYGCCFMFLQSLANFYRFCMILKMCELFTASPFSSSHDRISLWSDHFKSCLLVSFLFVSCLVATSPSFPLSLSFCSLSLCRHFSFLILNLRLPRILPFLIAFLLYRSSLFIPLHYKRLPVFFCHCQNYEW